MKIGAYHINDKETRFCVWGPLLSSLSLEIQTRSFPMKKDEQGYWSLTLKDILPETLYFYRLPDGTLRPDPASFYQPQGVHKPSMVINHSVFQWTDITWKGLPVEGMIIYEIHPGTFSEKGTFEGIAEKLDHLISLGVNAIELMPVSQFPGSRNWGYDGVHPFAVQNTYGGVEGLKTLVDRCHSRGIAVILDVVYNHIGPEGNYLHEFCPFFTDKYHISWGWAVNFDGPYSDGVRNYFIQNALYWFEHFHMDALRLDAIHGIYDFSATPFLKVLAHKVKKFSASHGREYYLIAESDLNDSRIIDSREQGGYELHAQWADDFHHSLHALLTKEKGGYYRDFGSKDHLKKIYTHKMVYDGIYSSYRKRTFGNSFTHCHFSKLIFSIQNHDQIGNRLKGERLSTLVDFEALKLAAGLLLLSPAVPLLFMGEEWAENNPFLYFISHSDPGLIEAVKNGRKKDFEHFLPGTAPLDPQDEKTFEKSRINWEKLQKSKHKSIFQYYQKLIHIRKSLSLHKLKDSEISLQDLEENVLGIRYCFDEKELLQIASFNSSEKTIRLPESCLSLLDSADKSFGGPKNRTECGDLYPKDKLLLSPWNFVLLKMGEIS